MSDQTGELLIRVFDGTRRLLTRPPKAGFLVTVMNPLDHYIDKHNFSGPEFALSIMPGDGPDVDFSVDVSADGYRHAGFFPVRPKPGQTDKLDLMLLPNNYRFDFSHDSWSELSQEHPKVADLLKAGAGSPAITEQRYKDLMTNTPKALACFFNITSVMQLINLGGGTVLDYIDELVWNDKKRKIAQDRFFANAKYSLIKDTEAAASKGLFGPEFLPWLFHQGAKISYKQEQFGEANVQLTFHEVNAAQTQVVVEPDIDYYKDPLAHTILEVIPNTLASKLSEPEQVYALHWIAAQRIGQDYEPPYSIVAA